MNIKTGMITVCLSSALVLNACGDSSNNSTSENTGEQQENNTEQSGQTNDSAEKLTKEKAKTLLGEFEDRLLPLTTEEGKVENFDTKQELIDDVSEIASEDVVERFVNQFYEEGEEGLFLKQEEYGEFLMPDKKLTLEQVETGKYRVVQQSTSNTNSQQQITAMLEYKNGLYRIMQYQVEQM